jgi:hypothetical protein
LITSSRWRRPPLRRLHRRLGHPDPLRAEDLVELAAPTRALTHGFQIEFHVLAAIAVAGAVAAAVLTESRRAVPEAVPAEPEVLLEAA